MLEDLRRPMVAGDQDVGKRLVVAQLHVEARPQLLDQVGFQQQRLGLGRGGDDLDRHGRGDHAQDARRQRRVDAGIGGQPLADVLGLADIEHVAGGIEHAVDAGRGRRQPHRVFDRRMADRQRAFGNRFAASSGDFRQARLVVLLGARMSRDRRRRRSGPAAADPAGNPAAPCARGLRMVGRIVIHGPKLSADGRHRQRSRPRTCAGIARPGNASLRMMSGR